MITSTYEMNVQESMFEFQAEMDLVTAEQVEIVLRGQKNEATVLTYNKSTNKLTLDCSKSGKKKDGIRRVKLAASNQLKLRIFVDRSSIEVFINEGEATMTSRIYPTESYCSVEFTSYLGKSMLKEATCWKLKDIWNEN
ncbi:GH32 C-terminal domain-containing protein [Priestia flexa]|uniref:GH32 C-terminal domain-containing protein n=1 Tax=Priestia flexa TaxID=86664 RepID=UPI001B337C76|nr:GH32 C-terminal domain-containing protein [Priestia flexa]